MTTTVVFRSAYLQNVTVEFDVINAAQLDHLVSCYGVDNLLYIKEQTL